MKLYLITNLPASYRVDLFNLLQQEFGNDIKICFISEPGIDFKKSIGVFEDELFIKQSIFYDGSRILSYLKFFLDLVRDKPDIIINAGMSPRTLFLLIYRTFFDKKIFIWWGGTFLVSKKIGYLKLIYRRLIASLVDGALFYSKLAKEYFEQLTRKKILNVILGNNTRNTLKYHKKILELQSNNNQDTTKLLTVGFLSKRKNIISCLKALMHIKGISSEFELLIAGDGPERSFLETFCKENGLKNVSFLGFISPDEMLKVYASADIYIHPSMKDQWPQTYNEAAAAGLPILISDNSGVYNEYIEEYKHIALFNPDDFVTLADRITLLIRNQSLRKEMGAKALACALKHDAQYACKQIMKLIDE